MNHVAHENADRSAMNHTLESLEGMSNRELEKVMLRGSTPVFEDLAGWEFHGVNTPAWAKLAGIKKFCKGFYWRDGALYGYNLAVTQNALTEPWLPRPNDNTPRRFGFYRVTRVDPTARDNQFLHAVLLDYSRGGNKRLDPQNGLRDYLVQVSPESNDLYLGKAYYAIGLARVKASYFVLRRWRKAIESVRDM